MTKGRNQSIHEETGFSLIPNQKLLALYSTMIRCRKVASQSSGHSRKNGASGGGGIIRGHEAAVVGTAIDLLPHDAVAPSLWPQAALLAINPFVPVVPRIALASQAKLNENGDRGITLLFSPGARGPRTQWLKALSFAAKHSLPFLFVSLDGVANSASSTNPETSPSNNRHAFPIISVDGNDVVAVYRVASEAITHARKGHGPTLIDCHLSFPGDPIENMHTYLTRKGLTPAS